MTDTQALAALLARVVSGTGEDRELDANVALLLGVVIARYRDGCFSLFRRGQNTMFAGGPGDEKSATACLAGCLSLERFTSSLDAVIALVERVMPGWDRRMSYERSGVDGEFWGWAELLDERDGKRFAAKTKTEPRALLAALIKTKMEEIAQ